MVKKILSIVITLIWMLLIFNFSNANAQSSSSISDGIIRNTIHFITKIDKNSKEMDKYIKTYSFPLRKCAHFIEYFILGILVSNMLYTLGMKRKYVLLASIICVIYALTDEFHQTFIDGRSGQISDVFLDSSGSLIATVVFYTYINTKIKRLIHK